MEKVESRSVIKFLHLKGYSAWKIYEEMKAVYGDDCPSYDTVVRWKRNFQTFKRFDDTDEVIQEVEQWFQCNLRTSTMTACGRSRNGGRNV